MPAADVHRGACLCGAVTFQIRPAYRWMAHCHCAMCRKHHGALFSTSVGVAAENMRLLSGRDSIMKYRSISLVRTFCGRCGSKVPSPSGIGDYVNVPAGTLDDDFRERPRSHIFTASKSPWVVLDDTLPRFDAYPEGVGLPVTRPVAPGAAVCGALAGSCLCGAVGFVVDGELRPVANCHCRRCRRSRGTAYATTGCTGAERLRWTRGAQWVAAYVLPDAPSFATAFCRGCGSLLPSVAPEKGIALVPLGALDTKPTSGPELHMFVDSKAAWYEIIDTLPRFQRAPATGIAKLCFG